MRSAPESRAPLMRARLLTGAAAALVAMAALPLHAQSKATSAAPSVATGAPNAEEQRYLDRALRSRALILAHASWTDLGGGCGSGELRSFNDTTRAVRATLDSAIADLERIIIARGVEESVDTPAGRALLRTVVMWEAAESRPRWDVDSKDDDKRNTIATGLTGKFFNPESKKCESYVTDDSVIVVVPTSGKLDLPRRHDGLRVALFEGEKGADRARDSFYSAIGGRDSSAVLTYTRIAPAIVWRDWGLIVVNRPAEARGIVTLDKSAGGAEYIFRRTKSGEWRLLLIAHSW